MTKAILQDDFNSLWVPVFNHLDTLAETKDDRGKWKLLLFYLTLFVTYSGPMAESQMLTAVLFAIPLVIQTNVRERIKQYG